MQKHAKTLLRYLWICDIVASMTPKLDICLHFDLVQDMKQPRMRLNLLLAYHAAPSTRNHVPYGVSISAHHLLKASQEAICFTSIYIETKWQVNDVLASLL